VGAALMGSKPVMLAVAHKAQGQTPVPLSVDMENNVAIDVDGDDSEDGELIISF